MSSRSPARLFALLGLCALTGSTTACLDQAELGDAEQHVELSPIERISLRSGAYAAEGRARAVSADGRLVLYTARNGSSTALWLMDRTTGTRTVVSLPGDRILDARMSADGNAIALSVNTGGTGADRAAGVYFLDRTTGVWTTVYLGTVEWRGLAISASGSHVGFVTYAALEPTDTNGTFDAYVWNRAKNRIDLGTRGRDGAILSSRVALRGKIFLSADGGKLAYTYENIDDHVDVALVRDLATGAIESLFRKPSGVEEPRWASDPIGAMTPDARYFLVDRSDHRMAVLDRLTSTLELVQRTTSGTMVSSLSSSDLALSDDGRLVLWASGASLDPIDTYNDDVFVHDRWMGTTQRLTAQADGGPANHHSGNTLTLAGGGSLAAFESLASNLVAGDTYDQDVFARPLDALPGEVVQLNRWRTGGGPVVEYQNAGLVTGGGIDTYVDGSGSRVTSMSGTATLVGTNGAAASASVQLTWNGDGYDGFITYSDPHGGSFDSRTAGTPTALTVTRIGDREALVDLAYASDGLRLVVRADEPHAVLASGWVWAHAETGDYDAQTPYAYNPTGWANRITRLALGQYRVRFARQAGALGAVVHVAAYGDGNAWCKYERQAVGPTSELEVYVRCFAPTGAPADARFVASFVHDRRITGAAGRAWLSFGGTGTSLRDSASSSGGSVLLGRTGTGLYGVTLSGQGGTPSNVMVTASGAGATRCKLSSFGGGLVNVRCHDAATGALADSGFELSYTVAATAPDAPGGFAYAGTSSLASYTPSASFAWSSSGGARTAGEFTWGGMPTHHVTFAGLSSSRSHAHVTAYGSDAGYCKPHAWYNVGTNLRVNVRCFDAAGTARRAPFALAYFHH